MTPDELREALEALHWSQRELAKILGINPTSAMRWASGREPVPSA